MKESLEIQELKIICNEVRRRVFETVLNAKSGHLGGCSSSVELMVSLYFGGILRLDPMDPQHPARDRVLVRGHLGPLRYSIFSLLGWIEESELDTYRKLGSRLQGHEAMELCPGVDITPSGSLGMLLSYGTGAAIALKNQNFQPTIYVFLGDGEEQEGNVSEAARHAASLGLVNLVCIMDQNTKQLSRPTQDADRTANVRKIWEGYGWSVQEITDGHSVEEILAVYRELQQPKKPTLVIAHTIKGFKLRGAQEHFCGYHTISTCPRKVVEEAINEQKYLNDVELTPDILKETLKSRLASIPQPPVAQKVAKQLSCPPSAGQKKVEILWHGNSEDKVSLVDAFVYYLRQLNSMAAASPDWRLYAMTADLVQLDYVELCGFNTLTTTYIDVGIREQHLLGLAHGIAVTDARSRILVNYGDAFLYRAADQLNVMAQAKSRVVIVADDGGLSGSQNGPTHQSCGQPGLLIAMPGVAFLEPTDAEDLLNCLNWAFNEYTGPVYIRLHTLPVRRLQPAPGQHKNTTFYVTHEPDASPRLVIVGSGLTMPGVITAAKRLGGRAINVLNMNELQGSIFVDFLENDIPLLTVYNGNPTILQSAVAQAVMARQSKRPSCIAGHGFELGTSGSLESLIRYFRMDADGIEEIARQKFPEISE